MPDITIDYVPLLTKSVFSLIALVVSIVLVRTLRGLLRSRLEETAQVHTLYMLGRNAILLVTGIMILLVWLGPSANLSVAMGILGAGIAFASQETIGSFAGYLNIVIGDIFRIGDRVRVGDVIGDVIDIGIMRTSLMEIGEWVKAEQYTGRIVTVANRSIFTAPVFNYTARWPYLWDEITIPISYDSNWRLARDIVMTHAQEYTADLQVHASTELQDLMRRYPVQHTAVEPTLYVVMTDNWIEMTLRYVVEARRRREVTAELYRELLEHFETEPNITVASATFEIVGIPPLRHVE